MFKSENMEEAYELIAKSRALAMFKSENMEEAYELIAKSRLWSFSGFL